MNATSSKVHTRCQKSQYAPTSRIDMLKALMEEPGQPNWNNTLARELRVLEGNDYKVRQLAKMREYRKEQAKKRDLIPETTTSDDDYRPNTFGEFDAEWC